MTRRTTLYFAFLFLALVSPVACRPKFDDTRSIEPGVNLLVSIDGKVEIKRANWSGFFPASLGATLESGDQLKLAEGAKAVVLCDELIIWEPPSGFRSSLANGCPSGPNPILLRPEGNLGHIRGEPELLIPYLIRPRATRLLTRTPMLEWNGLPKAKYYSVRLEGPGLVWESTTDKTEVLYPGTPSLLPEVSYLLVVTADDGSSSQDEKAANLTFRLIAETEAQEVRNAEDIIRDLDLPDDTQDLILAQVYYGHSLFAEAEVLLENLTISGNRWPLINYRLGELYFQTGLYSLAAIQFDQAIELAQPVQDAETLAAAQRYFGKVYALLGNDTEAGRWWQQSLDGYRTLGDREHIQEIENLLIELKNRAP